MATSVNPFTLSQSEYFHATSGVRYTSESTSKRTPSSELGKDEFLELLVTQMSNQDPLNPTSDQEFIAQMAQFSSLEQMQNMNSAIQMQSAYSLIGREVGSNMARGTDGYDVAQNVYGTVIGVTRISGVDYLQVSNSYSGEQALVRPDAVTTVAGDNGMSELISALEQIINK